MVEELALQLPEVQGIRVAGPVLGFPVYKLTSDACAVTFWPFGTGGVVDP